MTPGVQEVAPEVSRGIAKEHLEPKAESRENSRIVPAVLCEAGD